MGVGVYDDISPTITKNENGVDVRCPFYVRWKNLLTRVYSEKSLQKCPRYAGSVVCGSWLTFSNFKEWMVQQEWGGNDLDKDILGAGSLIYSPETAAFISNSLNSTITTNPPGTCLLGVTKKNSKFAAQAHDRETGRKFTGRCRHTQEEAHMDYLVMKIQRLGYFVGKESDERVNEALLLIVKHLENCVKNGTIVDSLYGRKY